MGYRSLTGPWLEGADGRSGGGVIGPSGGWHWALPESRLSPGRCRKSPDICPAAHPPAEEHHREQGMGINALQN